MSEQQGNGGMAGMMAQALGLGPVLAALNDPQFHEQIRQFAAAIVAINQRTERIEILLMQMDRRLTEFGIRADDWAEHRE